MYNIIGNVVLGFNKSTHVFEKLYNPLKKVWDCIK